jgi:type IV secretory pathway component VirB8
MNAATKQELFNKNEKLINMVIERAKQEYANTILADELGTVRLASCEVVYNLVNALTNMNNTYFKKGLKRYLEEISAYRLFLRISKRYIWM